MEAFAHCAIIESHVQWGSKHLHIQRNNCTLCRLYSHFWAERVLKIDNLSLFQYMLFCFVCCAWELSLMQHLRVSLLQIQLRLNDGIHHQSSVACITEKESHSAREASWLWAWPVITPLALFWTERYKIRFTSMSRHLAAVPSAICTGITRFIHTKPKHMGCFYFSFYIFSVLELCTSELGMWWWQ